MGMGDLIMQLLLGKKLNGNHGRYAIPIGVVKGATETYINLQRSIYSSDQKAILEQLVNQHLFMIRLFFGEEDGMIKRKM